MNLGVVTVNLPRIALESEGDGISFEIHERIAEDACLPKVERTKGKQHQRMPSSFYQYGAFGRRLEKEESVDQLFKNRRATISLGYIGLYEVATVFFGNSWECNPEAKEFTLIRDMKRRIEWHFSDRPLLSTRYREVWSIPDITDKEYYTNSSTTIKTDTVWKLDFWKFIQKQVRQVVSSITVWVSSSSTKLKAPEAVWDYAYDRVGYLGNQYSDCRYKCDFEGDFEPTERGFACPNCGNSDPKNSRWVKRTCGYLGNLKRPRWLTAAEPLRNTA